MSPMRNDCDIAVSLQDNPATFYVAPVADTPDVVLGSLHRANLRTEVIDA